MRFFIGVHHPNWLADVDVEGVPIFVSRNRLIGRKRFPEARGPFALDSGGFTELQRYGAWRLSEDAYVTFVECLRVRYEDRLCWVAPQDWMCEPLIRLGGIARGVVYVGTRLSVEQHQKNTVDNFVRLRRRLGALVVPVLQGWCLLDYWRCVQMYEDAGINLLAEPVVGVGSICRRQATNEAVDIITALAGDGFLLHGFGLKKQGLLALGKLLVSADSMAWSYAGRRRPNQKHAHMERSKGAFRKKGAADDCANCLEYALEWRADLLGSVEGAS